MEFNSVYKRSEFLRFLRNFLTDEYIEDISELNVQTYTASEKRKIKKAYILGKDEKLDLNVYEFHHDSDSDPRVTLTKEAFKILTNRGERYALAVFLSKNSENYRLSLLTIDLELDEKGIVKKYSNPKRFSFLLGPNAKIHTPSVQLKGKVKDLEDLKSRFSVEVVNKDFYKGISKFFYQLFDKIKLPSVDDETHKKNFIVRLIGRIIFIWFLKKKHSKNGIPLISEELLSSEAVRNYKDYYHSVLEPLFFEILNTPIEKRKEKYRKGVYQTIPFLNGGLFTPKRDDYYETDEFGFSKYINTLKIPDEWFENFFKFLDSYNFTIDENTPIDVELSVDPEMLGRIFENLLAEISPETGESARRQTGSYYTPREIVEFMVNVSLKHYLIEKTNVAEERIKKLLSYMEDVELSEDEKDLIFNAIFNMKIIDPACGSGAFPMGILQKVVWILEKIDPNAELWRETILSKLDPVSRSVLKERLDRETAQYTRKLNVIKNSIYGVDIQEIAVEIAKLRFFLSLIVDEHVDDSKPNRGIEPLPNLEFKFVCADTLIDIEDKHAVQVTFSIINELQRIMTEYFTARTNEEKENIKKKYYAKREELIATYLNWTKDWTKAKTGVEKYLVDWDPFGDEPAEWFNPFWMFGIEDGFDIVISNPPYIQLQKDHGKLASKYKSQNYKTFIRTGDIYCLFYERGIQLLKDKGFLCYITSNKWMRAKYGEKLRKFFDQYNPVLVVDLGPGVFENATVDTNIILIQKAVNQEKLTGISLKEKLKNISLEKYVENNAKHLPRMKKGPWFIGDLTEYYLKEKIENLGKPLKDWDVKIYYGIKTGCNEAFIIDEKTRQEILNNCKSADERERTEKIIKPVLRGRDIKRYYYKWAERYLIIIPAGWTNQNRNGKDPEEFIILQFPSLMRYLKQFEEKAKKRYDKGDYWWELRHCDYYPEFEKEKVVWKEMAQKPSFSYDPGFVYVIDTCRILTGQNIRFFVGFLNSLFLEYIFSVFYSGGGLGNKGIRYKSEFIKDIPIPFAISNNCSIVSQIEAIVNQIIFSKHQNPQSDTTKLEKEIDLLVYQLYDLTEKEIEIIEGN
ncbi:MAG TPA: hypothetical protein ENF81_11090 [Thermotogaceae bacterium]|nr:hypothetical protein [Thermotogaceae bacterium]